MTTTTVRLPRWLRLHPWRLLHAPRVELARADGEAVGVTVRGLVCGVCAARTETALLATPGVEAACVDLDAGIARLRVARGVRLDVEAAQASLERVVIAMPVRRWIERVARGAGERIAMLAEGRSR